MKFYTKQFFVISVLVFILSGSLSYAFNPDLSTYLINLSEGNEGAGYNDRVPEMVISGNTIHVIWVQNPSSYTANSTLMYRRSTDLGETWQESKALMAFKDGNYGTEIMSRRLAVDGDQVHICTADYDYGDKGTGRLHYFRSQNGGLSFEGERILAATSGNYKNLDYSFVKAVNGKVIIAYQGTGDKKGSWALFSNDGGNSFTETKLSGESSYVADLYYDGDQMIVIHGDYSTSYGYITVGKVWVSTSKNGTSFTTSKVSATYIKDDKENERCYVRHGDHYSSKIARSGNNIHVLFTGYANSDLWTTFYARSTNGGSSFEPAEDIGSGAPGSLQNGSETVAARNENVYWLAASTYPTNNNQGNKFYFANSGDHGTTFSDPREIMNPEISHVGKASLPDIVLDPTDETGKTLYLTGNWIFSTKSTDAGKSFSGSLSLAPFLKSNIISMSHGDMNSYMHVDGQGGVHWITQAKWRNGNDHDIFYRNVKAQPEQGTNNKAFYVENLKEARHKTDLIVVPSSETIQFDSAMTAEVWVKFDPATEANFSILAKVDGYDGSDSNPQGYQIGFRYENGKILVNAGIKTDKDSPVNWSGIDLNDSVWHHIALTYDANGGLNNFKLYVNGILHMAKTLTGAIVKEDGMLMLGGRDSGNGYYSDAIYYMDDVRLWNRALTQEELLKNQTKKLTGKEDGLMLYISFDDTFRDISGNGNDGIPVYNGTLLESDFDPPLPVIEVYQVRNEVSFDNKSVNADSWFWNFGDKNTSVLGNPKHAYSTPGEYTISLFARNDNSVVGALAKVTVEGLERVEPARAGDAGYVTIVVNGGGLAPEGSSFVLRKGGVEISGTDLYTPAPGQLAGRFFLKKAELGNYDVVVRRNSSELKLEGAFKVIKAELPDPWVSVTGRGATLFNMWQTYAINYGNKGNIDALGVPLNIVISNLPGLDVEFIDFKVDANDYMKTHTPEIVELMDTLYDVVDDYFGPGHDARFYPLYLPVVEANSTHSIRVRIKSPANFFIETWTHDPFFEIVDSGTKNATIAQDAYPDDETRLNACITLSAAHAASSSLMDMVGMVLPVDCVYDFATFAFNPWDKAKPEHERNAALQNWGYALASAAVSCIGDLTPIKAIKIGIKIASIVNNMYQGYLAHQDCLNAFDPRYKNRKGVRAQSSFDPNEMVGPSGFGDQNFIPEYNRMPYTILFENKKEATAPAHIVAVTDTLDLSVFDISEFGFSSFGWGDTIFSPPGSRLKEFSKDIDMRPGLQLIARVSAKLDTVTGIVRWEFLSLNPVTLDLEEDPDLGFLPPNVSSPEGEGFVSFSVGLKEELGTNDEIRNKASIIFDANDPIVTNEYLNTLDLDVPESRVYPLEATTDSRFPVAWSGTDAGSGIRDYSVYVMVNDTALLPWMVRTTETTAMFEGEVGSSYKFYSIATDNVSLAEATPAVYDASTTVTVNVKEFENKKSHLKVFPNPARNRITVLFPNAPCGAYIVEIRSLTGQLLFSEIHNDMELSSGLNISTLDLKNGQYFVRVLFGKRSVSEIITIQK